MFWIFIISYNFGIFIKLGKEATVLGSLNPCKLSRQDRENTELLIHLPDDLSSKDDHLR